MADLLYRASLAVVPPLYVAASTLLFSTCRLEVENPEVLEELLSAGGGIAVFWHYSFLYIFYHLRRCPGVVMVSASRDGEYIARVARILGYEAVRGSSHRRGVRGLKELVRHVRQGRNAGVVGDGSQGPARRLQPGCLLLSAKSGRPVLPVVWAASRYKAFASWDRTVLPMPFARIRLAYGRPLQVPAGISSAELEEYRLRLEEEMNELYRKVWRRFGVDAHDRADSGG
ncbi:lysophospholipid acyltransferase family protein [Thermodesulfobacteriota bacterium B35]